MRVWRPSADVCGGAGVGEGKPPFGEGVCVHQAGRSPSWHCGGGSSSAGREQTRSSRWIGFARSSYARLQPPPVRAGVMLALRICLIWVLLCRCSGNSKSYTFIKGSRDILFCSLDSSQGEILSLLSATIFAVNRKFTLALQRESQPFFGLKMIFFIIKISTFF